MFWRTHVNLLVKMVVSLLTLAEVDDILLIIQEYVSINAFLNSSKELAALKMRYFRWNITIEASQRYNRSQPYRDILMSLGQLQQKDG